MTCDVQGRTGLKISSDQRSKGKAVMKMTRERAIIAKATSRTNVPRQGQSCLGIF